MNTNQLLVMPLWNIRVQADLHHVPLRRHGIVPMYRAASSQWKKYEGRVVSTSQRNKKTIWGWTWPSQSSPTFNLLEEGKKGATILGRDRTNVQKNAERTARVANRTPRTNCEEIVDKRKERGPLACVRNSRKPPKTACFDATVNAERTTNASWMCVALSRHYRECFRALLLHQKFPVNSPMDEVQFNFSQKWISHTKGLWVFVLK